MTSTQSPTPDSKGPEDSPALSRSSTTDSSVNINAESSSKFSTTNTPSTVHDNGHTLKDFSQISTKNRSSKRGTMMTTEGIGAALNSMPWF